MAGRGHKGKGATRGQAGGTSPVHGKGKPQMSAAEKEQMMLGAIMEQTPTHARPPKERLSGAPKARASKMPVSLGTLIDLPLPGCDELNFAKRAGRVGIKNLGNTCFMNTGLQCLCHIEPFAAYFLTGKYKGDINDSNPKGSGGSLAQAFAKLQEIVWLKDLCPLDPTGFHKKLSSICPHLFAGGEQQDVQEFLAFCLDGLHEDLNRADCATSVPESPALEEPDADVDDEMAAALAWMQHLKRDKSFIVDLLQGQLCSSLSCMSCGHSSRRFDPFLYLSVPVTSDMKNITESLEKFHEEELLTEDDQWLCPKCNENVDARKKMQIWKLPPVLVLHLKRFACDPVTEKFHKLTNTVTVPLKLDLSQHCASQQRDGATYELCCVANHHGKYGHGHYAATCRMDGFDLGHQWFFFDDHNIAQISTEQAETMASKYGYVLFFARSSERNAALGPKRQSVTGPECWPHWVSTRNSKMLQFTSAESSALRQADVPAVASGDASPAKASTGRRKSTLSDAQLAALAVGDRIMCLGVKPSTPGTIRFVGSTSFSAGEWIGVELDEDVGKNDGIVQGIPYFTCRPQSGLFCRRSVGALKPIVAAADDPPKHRSSKESSSWPAAGQPDDAQDDSLAPRKSPRPAAADLESTAAAGQSDDSPAARKSPRPAAADQELKAAPSRKIHSSKGEADDAGAPGEKKHARPGLAAAHSRMNAASAPKVQSADPPLPAKVMKSGKVVPRQKPGHASSSSEPAPSAGGPAAAESSPIAKPVRKVPAKQEHWEMKERLSLPADASINVSDKSEYKEAIRACAFEADKLRAVVQKLGSALGGGAEEDDEPAGIRPPAWATGELQPDHKALLEKLLGEAGARLGKKLEERLQDSLEQQVKEAIDDPLDELRKVAKKVRKLRARRTR